MGSPRGDVEEVFLRAVEMDPAERLAFLDAACTGGPVRTRVEALLKAHDTAGDFLDGPAVRPAPPPGAQEARAPEGDPPPADEPPAFLDPSDTPGRLGRLGHYEVLDVLGRGGMGVVLRAVDVRLHRVVALKVLAPHLAADAVARARVLREARAAAAVSHPHVVAIHGVDESNGLPYLVMEYVAGPSLQQKIDDGPLHLAQILRIGVQVASGLAAAHAQGLVHRDVKPANILLENGLERVKITDFGLARAADDVRLTRAGAVYGTPLYMSPEQARGDRVDQRSDLFSLGGVLYAMCTGLPPFRGDTGLAVLRRVCDDTPRPIREANADVPEPLAGIVNRLLAKDPDDRFPSAGAVAELLGRYLAHVQHDPLAPFPTEDRPQPRSVRAGRGGQCPQPRRPPARSGLRGPLAVSAVVLLTAIAAVAVAEGTRLTRWTGLAAPGSTSADPGGPAAATAAPVAPGQRTRHAAGATDRPVKVFVLAGDSNMAGRATVALLKYQATQAGTKRRFRHLLNDGEWAVREDVWVKNFRQKGNLTVGFGDAPDRFGPELEFGHVVGDHFDEQVLLIKTCWGGHDMYRPFRPPSAGLPAREFLEQQQKELQKAKATATLADVEQTYGATYREMVKEVRETVADLGAHFPGYRGQGVELAGFVWFSGWNDMIDYNPFYAELLAHFIRDVRGDLKDPGLPVVIGQLGVDPDAVRPGTNDSNFRAAQAAVARLPEFAGNVTLVPTDPFWDREADAVAKKGPQHDPAEWEKVGSDLGFHYLGSARTFCAIGQALGQAALELRRGGARD